MASSPSLWYGNYKGAVYPLDLHASPTDCASCTREVKSLVSLCAAYIVQDSGMTEQALAVIPKTLCVPLMQEALEKNREMAIRCIIGSWPMQTFILGKLVPRLFVSVLPLYNSNYLGEMVRRGLRYTTSLAHTFVEALKNNSSRQLKYVDLSGFPTAEVIVYFLATHCMLAHNEVRHNTIISMYNQAVQQAGTDLPEITLEAIKPTGHSLPQDCAVVIKLDAFVTSESTHSELCKALKVSSFPDRKLRIIINRLAMTCLGHARVSLLLKQVDPQHLTGLQLQYNALTARDLVKLMPALKTLVCLESLDLSCNSIFFYHHEETCNAAAEIFSSMPNLTRLDLSNNRIKTRLRRLLETITRPLTYLRVAGCGLTVTDLTYLSHSHHLSGLQELDLSENQLKTCDRQVREILSGTRSTLQVLEVEDCCLDDQAVRSFIPYLSHLTSLIFFNMAENRLSQNCQVSVLAAVAQVVSFQVFKSSYAVDCYEHEREAEEDRIKAEAVGELNTIANQSSVHMLRSRPVQIVLTELEKVMDTE